LLQRKLWAWPINLLALAVASVAVRSNAATDSQAGDLDFAPCRAPPFRHRRGALDGNEREALKARVFLRELLGRINLKPEGEELWAEYGVAPPALLKVAGAGFVGSRGQGMSCPCSAP